MDSQWLAIDRKFFPGTPVYSTIKTDHYDITDILLKVALNTINHTTKEPQTYSKNKTTKCWGTTQQTILETRKAQMLNRTTYKFREQGNRKWTDQSGTLLQKYAVNRTTDRYIDVLKRRSSWKSVECFKLNINLVDGLIKLMLESMECLVNSV